MIARVETLDRSGTIRNTVVAMPRRWMRGDKNAVGLGASGGRNSGWGRSVAAGRRAWSADPVAAQVAAPE